MKNDMDFDIAIIGAGPAGTAAAISIPHSYSIIHFEKSSYPTKKLCGGLLTEDAQKHVTHLTAEKAIPSEIRCAPVMKQLRSVDFDCGMTTVIDVGYDNIDRNGFDVWLASFVNRKNYRLEHSTKVIDVKGSNAGYVVSVVSANKQTDYRVRIVIDCSGWACFTGKLKNARKIARRFALQFTIVSHAQVNKPSYLQEYRAFFDKTTTDWFGWTIPKNDELVIGVGFNRNGELGCNIKNGHKINNIDSNDVQEERELSLTSKFAKFVGCLAEKGYIKLEDIPDYQNKETIKDFFVKYDVKGCPITSLTSIKQLNFGENGIFVLGEAAGLVSPSSGDGISYALSSGIVIGKVLEQAASKRMPSKTAIEQEYYRRYADLLAYETRELRFNVQKAKMLSNPKARNAALWFLTWHNGNSMERL